MIGAFLRKSWTPGEREAAARIKSASVGSNGAWMANPVKLPELRIEPELKGANIEPKGASIGDLVQWTSGGVDQFETPRRVRAVQRRDRKEWAFVEGTRTGIPLNELTVVTPKSDATALPSTTAPSGPIGFASMNEEREYLRGILSRGTGYRLLVSGDIGPKELGRMIKLLQAQQAILEDDTDKEGRDDI